MEAHRKGFRNVRPLHQLAPRTHRYRILPDAKPRGIAPRLAGADVELPTMPRALHHLARPGVAVLSRRRRFDKAGLDAVGEAAAAVRAAIGEREELAAEIVDHDRTAADLDQLALAGRDLIDAGDDMAGHQANR